jgi:hypothetical protein
MFYFLVSFHLTTQLGGKVIENNCRGSLTTETEQSHIATAVEIMSLREEEIDRDLGIKRRI